MINVESAIESRQFASIFSDATYTGWFLDGKQVGCSCGARANHPHIECKHIIAYNAAMQAITGEDLEAHVSDDLNSCFHCGYLTKGFICHRCS